MIPAAANCRVSNHTKSYNQVYMVPDLQPHKIMVVPDLQPCKSNHRYTWYRVCNHTKPWWSRIFNHTKSYQVNVAPDLQPHKIMVVPDFQPHKIISYQQLGARTKYGHQTQSLAADSKSPGLITRTQKFDHISGVLKKTKAKTGYQSGENRPPSTTIGITKSDGYWTIISEGTSINENIVTIERKIL